MAEFQDQLRTLALNDERFIASALGVQLGECDGAKLDPKMQALVRLGALLALDAAESSLQWAVGEALAAGVSQDEIVGALMAVAPIAGIARVVSAAPEIALALGYDVDVPFETRRSRSE